MQHSVRSHALLGASSAKRWIHCPPSAVLCDNIKEERVSEYAEEGTTAHEYAELLVKHYTQLERPAVLREGFERIRKSKWYNQEFETYVQEYVKRILDEINEVKSSDPFAVCSTEIRLNYEKWAQGGFGTLDQLIIANRTARLRDLKFGRGVQVDAYWNEQLMLYALGVYQEFHQYFDIDKFILTIDQPRRGNLSTFEVSTHELLTWGNTVVKPSAELAYNGLGERKCGDWCKFCKVRNDCYEMNKAYGSFRQMSFTPIDQIPQPDQDRIIQEVLKYGNAVKEWIGSVQRLAFTNAMAGRVPEGYKVIHGRSTRKYLEPEKIEELLLLSGIEPSKIYDLKLKPLSRLEKSIGVREFNEHFKAYIHEPEGVPTLVKSGIPGDNIALINEFKDLTK